MDFLHRMFRPAFATLCTIQTLLECRLAGFIRRCLLEDPAAGELSK